MSKIRTISQLVEALRRGYVVSDGVVGLPSIERDAAIKLQKAERHFCIELAGTPIAINSLYDEVYKQCEDYLSMKEPQIIIDIREQDIEFERKETAQKFNYYSDSYLETLSVYRKISDSLLDYNTLLMHGAVIAEHGRAFMFTASSGTGKTTHIVKWLERRPESFVVNGDKPLIKVTDKHVFACGTPWCGKEQMNTNAIVPLHKIILMHRGDDNFIHEITFAEAFSFLLQQTYRPNEPEGLQKTIALLSKIKNLVRFYSFSFNNLKDDCFEVAYSALTEGK